VRSRARLRTVAQRDEHALERTWLPRDSRTTDRLTVRLPSRAASGVDARFKSHPDSNRRFAEASRRLLQQPGSLEGLVAESDLKQGRRFKSDRGQVLLVVSTRGSNAAPPSLPSPVAGPSAGAMDELDSVRVTGATPSK
jgi:hypothetical protein